MIIQPYKVRTKHKIADKINFKPELLRRNKEVQLCNFIAESQYKASDSMISHTLIWLLIGTHTFVSSHK